jgi:hypothetical protein
MEAKRSARTIWNSAVNCLELGIDERGGQPAFGGGAGLVGVAARR